MTVPSRPGEDAWLAIARERTPARLFLGRAGAAYRTETQLDLRADHAFARDAVLAELDLVRDLGDDLIQRFALFEVTTCAASKADHLAKPELGRSLSDAAKAEVAARCSRGVDFQIVIGDGLSVAAVASQAKHVLPGLVAAASERGWTVGQPFMVRHCRVGVLNDVGELLGPNVVVLLIGERPGLACAQGLSAYMAYRPRVGHTDANRNLISNIHANGVVPEVAIRRIVALAALMFDRASSGVAIKEGDVGPRAGSA